MDEIVWLSTMEAALRCGVTTRTLYRMIDEGQVTAYRFGRVIRLQESDVVAFIAASRVIPGTLGHLVYASVETTDEDEEFLAAYADAADPTENGSAGG